MAMFQQLVIGKDFFDNTFGQCHVLKEGEPSACRQPIVRSLRRQELSSCELASSDIWKSFGCDHEAPRISSPIIALMVEPSRS